MNALKTVFNTRYELHNAYPSLNEFVLQYEILFLEGNPITSRI